MRRWSRTLRDSAPNERDRGVEQVTEQMDVPWYMPERLHGCYLANRDRIEADIAASPPLEGERLATVVRLLRSGDTSSGGGERG